MKRYTDYSQRELVRMNDGEIEKLIEIECMHHGVSAIYIPPVLKAIEEIDEADKVVYEIFGIYFTDIDEAYEFMEFLSTCKSVIKIDYDYNFGSKYKYIKQQKEGFNINQFKCYSKELYEIVEEKLKNNKDNEEYNAVLTSNHNEKMKYYEEIKKEVWDAVHAAYRDEGKFFDAKCIFEKYIEMSDGNIEIAKAFFAKTEYSHLIERILNEGNYDA